MRYLIILFALGLSLMMPAQNIVKMEYWIDHDPGFGLATQVNGFTAQPDITTYNFSIPQNLSLGTHFLGMRTRDALNRWGLTNLYTFYVTDSAKGVISKVEYFWDNDPGFGNSTTDTVYSATFANHNFDTIFAQVPYIDSGFHTLYIRSLDSKERWSHTNYTQVEIVGTVDTSSVITSIKNASDDTYIRMLPNPVCNQLSITLSGNSMAPMMLFDAKGCMLLHTSINGSEYIDMSSYPPGSYYVAIWLNDKIYRRTVIKQ